MTLCRRLENNNLLPLFFLYHKRETKLRNCEGENLVLESYVLLEISSHECSFEKFAKNPETLRSNSIKFVLGHV